MKTLKLIAALTILATPAAYAETFNPSSQPLMIFADGDDRQERRQERGRSDERQDKRDCRQEEGRVGKDKRDCKQEEVRDGVRGRRDNGDSKDS